MDWDAQDQRPHYPTTLKQQNDLACIVIGCPTAAVPGCARWLSGFDATPIALKGRGGRRSHMLDERR